MTKGQIEYEKRRAAKMGMSLEDWLEHKKKPTNFLDDNNWGDHIRMLQEPVYKEIAPNTYPDVGVEMRKMGLKDITLNLYIHDLLRIPVRDWGNKVEYTFGVETNGVELVGSFWVKKKNHKNFRKVCGEFTMINVTLADVGNTIQQNAALAADQFLPLTFKAMHKDRCSKMRVYQQTDEKGSVATFEPGFAKEFFDNMED